MHQAERHVERRENHEYCVALRDDGIIHVFFKEGLTLDVPLQMKLLEIYKELAGDEKRLFIFEADKYVSVTKAARDNAVRLENEYPSIASVIYVQNPLYKLIANFYKKINKPQKPYKVVGNFQAGIEWLHSHKNKVTAN